MSVLVTILALALVQDVFDFDAQLFSVQAPTDVDVVDYDGDGTLDIAVASSTARRVELYTGDGTGGFAHAGGFVDSAAPILVASGDVDGDGAVDLVTGQASLDRFALHRGFAPGGVVTGTFSAPEHFSTVDEPADLLLADFDTDGFLDAALCSVSEKSVGIRRGMGVGTGSTILRGSTGEATWTFKKSEKAFGREWWMMIGAPSFQVVAQDIDVDGRLDLAIGQEWDFGVYTLFGDGAGDFALHYDAGLSGGPVSMNFVDLNADGHLDLVTTVTDFEVTLDVNVGSGGGNFSLYQIVDECREWCVVGRFNDNGRPDVAFAGNGGVKLLEGIWTKTWTTAQPQSFGAPGGNVTAGQAIDLDGDGLDDLVTVNAPLDRLCVMMNRTP